MADNYGVTFAQKLLLRGDYEQAAQAAEQHASRDPHDPEPHHDRARALAALSRNEEAVAEYARAIELDREAAVLPDWEVDDGLFSTVVAWGQELGGVDEKLRALGRYKELLPAGSHLAEAEEWALRFRGLLPTTFIKPRD